MRVARLHAIRDRPSQAGHARSLGHSMAALGIITTPPK